eukprot:TRINITY_DN9917_c0_g1_i1.p2 TRINITY_DN9917_c0_g1~~TRINITY_DN9917_c0_g1_i1.p2  ORF type:complete len:222 (+),score=28.63 TRINITY_DN9917_c0_g1_i1:61-666(+)
MCIRDRYSKIQLDENLQKFKEDVSKTINEISDKLQIPRIFVPPSNQLGIITADLTFSHSLKGSSITLTDENKKASSGKGMFGAGNVYCDFDLQSCGTKVTWTARFEGEGAVGIGVGTRGSFENPGSNPRRGGCYLKVGIIRLTTVDFKQSIIQTYEIVRQRWFLILNWKNYILMMGNPCTESRSKKKVRYCLFSLLEVGIQ